MLAVVSGAVLLFLCLPIAVVVPMSFSSASSLTFPPPGLSLRWYESFFGDPRWVRAASTSALVALASSVAALVLGSIAAYGLVRGTFRGRALLEGNFIAPLILPPVITAVALYIFFAQIGLLGTILGLIIAHTILTVPYVVLLMSVAIRQFDVRIEQVAYSLGASWLRMFKSVLLPNLLPSVLAAWIFAFIISFDEVIVTLVPGGRLRHHPQAHVQRTDPAGESDDHRNRNSVDRAQRRHHRHHRLADAAGRGARSHLALERRPSASAAGWFQRLQHSQVADVAARSASAATTRASYGRTASMPISGAGRQSTRNGPPLLYE